MLLVENTNFSYSNSTIILMENYNSILNQKTWMNSEIVDRIFTMFIAYHKMSNQISYVDILLSNTICLPSHNNYKEASIASNIQIDNVLTDHLRYSPAYELL